MRLLQSDFDIMIKELTEGEYMGIISCASGSSCWRGLDYYKNNKVIKLNKINDFEFSAIIDETKKYDVYLNIEHPRKSKCNCPLANGKKII